MIPHRRWTFSNDQNSGLSWIYHLFVEEYGSYSQFWELKRASLCTPKSALENYADGVGYAWYGFLIPLQAAPVQVCTPPLSLLLM